MIGRLKPILSILDTDAHQAYSAHYCGICAATKRTYDRRAALGHSSEMVLVSLLLEGIEPEAYVTCRTGCTVLPLIPRTVSVAPKHRLAVAAGVLATLQLDIRDARQDGERRIKQFLCRPHRSMRGAIVPTDAWKLPIVQNAIGSLAKDDVAKVVAGVIGSVFQLAGCDESIVDIGCRIGHAMGRLMNLSDAVEDYFDDKKHCRASILPCDKDLPDIAQVERLLVGALDDLAGFVKLLPLKRHVNLIETLVEIHARARVEIMLSKFRKKIAKLREAPRESPWPSDRPDIGALTN